MTDIQIKERISDADRATRDALLKAFHDSPIPDAEFLKNLALYLRRPELERIFFMREMYEKIVDVHGIVVEFGVRWGANLALFETLRGIFEPYNHNRRIVGFDTFAGFPSVHEKDGTADIATPGAYSVTPDYEAYLEAVLGLREAENPKAFVRKTSLVAGDASQTLPQFLKENPETIIALAYFDFDIYQPTRDCLEAIRPHLTRGSIIGFDELNIRDFPGETLALRDVFGLDRFRIQRSRFSGVNSYVVVD